MGIRVELRKGGLEAFAVVDQAGDPLDLDLAARLVLEGLRQSGVDRPVDEFGVRTALQAGLGDPCCASDGILVARGEPPKPGIGAQLLPAFPVRETDLPAGGDPFALFPQNVVYPGEVILTKTPPSEGIAGQTLLGTGIPGPRGADVSVIAGEGVRCENGVLFRSSAYGVALFQQGRLWVEDALRVFDDGFEVRMTLLPDSRLGEEAHFGKLLAALGSLGVREGIDRDALAAAVREARSSGSAVRDVLAARGRRPVDGHEPDYRLAIDLEKKAYKALEGERIDFREMETVKNVRKGDVLAEQVPRTEPVTGFRVDGSVLKPAVHRAEGLKPGENTRTSEDGRHILADADGMIIVKTGKFHVVDQYLVPADVDFSTGNIRASGSVRIRGHVKPGFIVEAGKDLEVQEDVWEAQASAQGDIRIRGAIAAGSRVKAGRSISARYILNSRVEAEGDLDVNLSITGSEVYVNGIIRVMGPQGIILGGEVNAARGIEARTIGAPSARTRVAAGIDLRAAREKEEIQREQTALKAEIASLQQTLGKEFLKDPRTALLALPPALRKGKIEVLQKMLELHKRETELAARCEELAKREVQVKDVRIAVVGDIHPGTVVIIGPASATLTETVHHAALYYSPEENRVLWRRV